MPVRIILAAVLLLVGAVAYAQVTTYTFQSEPFHDVFGTYVAGQNLTGHITLSEPLPPNSSSNVNSILLSYSFSDGVVTLDDSNSEAVSELIFTTDATGSIQSYSLTFWESPLATAIGQIFTGMDIFFEPGFGAIGCEPSKECLSASVQINSGDTECFSLSGGQCVGGVPNPPGANGGAIFRIDNNTGFNPNFDNSIWLGGAGPQPAAVPALGQGSLLLLMLMLSALGSFAMRRRG